MAMELPIVTFECRGNLITVIGDHTSGNVTGISDDGLIPDSIRGENIDYISEEDIHRILL